MLKTFCPKHEPACSGGYTNDQGGETQGVGNELLRCGSIVKPQPQGTEYIRAEEEMT